VTDESEIPCPLCGDHGLVAYHTRPAAACARCGALERQRALVIEFGDALVRSGGGCCMEVAPLNAWVFGGFLRERGWRYEGVDKRLIRERSDPGGFDDFIDRDRDLADLHGMPTDGYELVILQHVLEQVVDYRAALDELARVLEPGGRALLEIPGHTQTQTEIKPSDRYGNRWMFGDDLVEDLRRRFGSVRRHKAALGQYRGSFYVCVGA